MSEEQFFQSLLIFLSILAANQGPGLARKINLPLSRMPVSRRLLGENKTVAAYYTGPFLAMLAFSCMLDQLFWWRGLWVGLGAVLGDHTKSLIKRRLGKKPGEQWWPDRIDFAVGGGLAAWLCMPQVQFGHVLWVIIITWPVHYIGNRFSYKRGWRDTPH